MARTVLIVLLSLAAALCRAAPDDPQLERRVTALSQQLRCLVCQNQTIADSQAELAVDLRREVRDKLRQGMSEREVADYMVQRYGDFVLYRPPFKASTWLLWLGPLLLLAAGLAMLWTRLARGGGARAPLAPEARQRAARLLDDQEAP